MKTKSVVNEKCFFFGIQWQSQENHKREMENSKIT